MGCGIGCRCGLDLALLWLWGRLTAAASIQPLAGELPFALGAALKKKKKKVSKHSLLYNSTHFHLVSVTSYLGDMGGSFLMTLPAAKVAPLMHPPQGGSCSDHLKLESYPVF